MKSTPKILLTTDADVWAGTERHMLDLAVALQTLGATVSVSAPQQSSLQEHCERQNIPFVAIEKKGLIDFEAIRRLIRLLRHRKIDIIHAHNGRTQLSAAIAITLARRGKVVFTQHFISPFHTQLAGVKGQVYGKIHAAVRKKTARIIAISGAVERSMLESHPASKPKIVIVSNGIDDPQSDKRMDAQSVREKWDVPPHAPFFTCAARLEREKEISVLVEAFALVLETNPEAQLRIAGQGDLDNELKRQIEELNIGQNVRLVGFLSDALSLFAAADSMVLPAPAEPFGLVFIEAMGLEKPVVACNGGAAPEIIVDGETGLLVPPSDAAAMAKAITFLIEQPERARQMGKNGRERFLARYTRERMAENTMQIYSDIWRDNA